MQFTMTFDIGTIGAESYEEVAALVTKAGHQIFATCAPPSNKIDEFWTPITAPVIDDNGDRIGGWTITETQEVTA